MKKEINEDMAGPTNVVGSGNIAGAGVGPQGEPGVKKKKRYKTPMFKRFKDFIK